MKKLPLDILETFGSDSNPKLLAQPLDFGTKTAYNLSDKGIK